MTNLSEAIYADESAPSSSNLAKILFYHDALSTLSTYEITCLRTGLG